MSMRCITSVANESSKKGEDHSRALSPHIMHNEFARPHKMLANPCPRIAAVAAGVANHIWEVEVLVSWRYLPN
jgi:hypothetical protein